MIENPALGKPYVCRLDEEAALPLTYIKDIIRGTEMLYYAPEAQIKTVCYNIAGVSPARTAGELQRAVKKFIPEADITFKPEPELVSFFEAYFGGTKSVDDSRAKEEWGWEPRHTDFEKIVEDFIREVRTRPQRWGIG
jgi:nucleoside-diphosphate-sugar epimerase